MDVHVSISIYLYIYIYIYLFIYIYIYIAFTTERSILIVTSRSLQWRQRKQGGTVGADEACARRFDHPFPVPGLLL